MRRNLCAMQNFFKLLGHFIYPPMSNPEVGHGIDLKFLNVIVKTCKLGLTRENIRAREFQSSQHHQILSGLKLNIA